VAQGQLTELARLATAALSGWGPAQPAMAALAFGRALLLLALACGVGACVGAVLAALAQRAPIPSAAGLKPQGLDRLVSSGIKRTLGLQGLKTHLLHLLRLAALVAVTGWFLAGRGVPAFADGATPAMLGWLVALQLAELGKWLLAVLLVFAALDWLIERRRFMRQMRMTRADLRDEYRETDGDPLIKARIRRLQRQRAAQRMQQAVRQATVVVTNPTHVAIALAYDGATGRAPRVVAKGVDEAAHRLRRFAIAAGVPIVSNPPLARALLPVPLDREVPEAHYRAMAAVIAYVLSLRTRNRAT